MTRPVVLLAAWCDYAAPKPPASLPRGVVGSAADRYRPVSGRPRADSPVPGGAGDAAAEVEGAPVHRAIPRRRQVTPSFEYRTIRLPRKRHLHRRARRWVGWRPVDRFGAWVREAFPAFVALSFVVLMAGLYIGVASMPPGGAW